MKIQKKKIGGGGGGVGLGGGGGVRVDVFLGKFTKTKFLGGGGWGGGVRRRVRWGVRLVGGGVSGWM